MPPGDCFQFHSYNYHLTCVRASTFVTLHAYNCLSKCLKIITCFKKQTFSLNHFKLLPSTGLSYRWTSRRSLLPCQDAQVGRKWGPYIQLNGAHSRSPDGLCVLLSARSMSAPNGQPIDPYIWVPSRSHLPSPFGLPISAPRRQPRWALCYFVRALDVRPKWAAHRSVYMGSF